METKKCSKCGRELPLAAFGNYAHSSDGLYSSCKECINAAQKANRAKRKRQEEGGVNEDLALFTTKVLLDEIKARGYSGTLEYKKTIRL